MKTSFIYDCFFCVKTHDGDYAIPCPDICVFSCSGSYTIINYFFNNKQESLKISYHIGYFIHELDHEFYFRTHKAYVVNLMHVDHLLKQKPGSKCSQILMTDGSLVDLAYDKRKEFLQKLLIFRATWEKTA